MTSKILTVIAVMFLYQSPASALMIVTYDFAAALTPSGLNGGGTPPTVSSATGSFSYDSDEVLDEFDGGFFTLTGFTFLPAADTTAGSFLCEPITICIGGIGPNLFKPSSAQNLRVELRSGPYLVHFGTAETGSGAGRYSDNNAFGNWDITSLALRTEDVTVVPEPGSLALLGAGLLGLGFVRRRRAG